MLIDFDKKTLLLPPINHSRGLTIILSGLAKGADTLAVKYANEHNYQCLGYTADWGQFGKSAGIRRNTQMADNADALIAFWDGSSRGTKNMIEQAQAKGLQIRIIKY